MLPEPLHPVVVHFPIVLTVLLPIFAAGALWAIRRGVTPTRAWALPLALTAALTLSAFVAVETGEGQEERVESVVSEQVLHTHEEAGKRFLILAGALTLIMGAGLLAGRAGVVARAVGTVGAVALVAAAVQVGAAGGDLVYRHGAAAAYTTAATSTDQPATEARGEGRDDH